MFYNIYTYTGTTPNGTKKCKFANKMKLWLLHTENFSVFQGFVFFQYEVWPYFYVLL